MVSGNTILSSGSSGLRLFVHCDTMLWNSLSNGLTRRIPVMFVPLYLNESKSKVCMSCKRSIYFPQCLWPNCRVCGSYSCILTRDAMMKLCSDPMRPTCCACNSTSESMLNEQSSRIFFSPESFISRSSFLKQNHLDELTVHVYDRQSRF